MKKYTSYLYILLIITFTSCIKNAFPKPDVEIEINKTTFTVGDTAKFKISGIPYNLVFYSGEPGNDYYSRNTYTASGGTSSMIFTTALAAASGSSTATNLKVLVSNNFSGNYNQTEIAAASWVDVTSQVTVPGTDTVELDPYKAEGKKLYVAFRFETVDSTKSQRQVTVSGFSLRTVFPNQQTYVNASNVYFAGFAPFDFAGATGAWSIPVTSNTNNSFVHPLVAANSAKDDDWAISTGFTTNSIAPSTGIALKAIASNPVTEHTYVFTKAGTYKVVFAASNNDANTTKEIVKEFTVTVN